jgi:hypothetical protein
MFDLVGGNRSVPFLRRRRNLTFFQNFLYVELGLHLQLFVYFVTLILLDLLSSIVVDFASG